MSQGIILLGIKHCGKSTLGQMLGKQFNCPFFDTDNIISEMTGKTPREIYQQQGAEAFMEAEARACDYLGRYLHTLGKDEYVIATGGGICTNQQALDSLHKLGFFLFLEVPEEVAAQRIIDEIQWVDGVMTNLPAYIASENPASTEDVAQIFGRFYQQRSNQYRKLAQITCNLKGETAEENCQLLCEALFSQDCHWD